MQSVKGEAQYQGLFPSQAASVIPRSSLASELGGLSIVLLKLCGLDIFADASNPYHGVAELTPNHSMKGLARCLCSSVL